MEKLLSGEGSGSIAETEGESNAADRVEQLGNCFQNAPLRGSVDPFAMLAD